MEGKEGGENTVDLTGLLLLLLLLPPPVLPHHAPEARNGHGSSRYEYYLHLRGCR